MTKECYHCGEDVPAGSDFHVEILGEDREMCCVGCEAVASTIVESGLTSYYQYRTESAERVDLVPKELVELSLYDNKDVQAEFVQHQDGVLKTTLSLEGVSCAACAWLIEKQLNQKPGIASIRVNTSTHRAMVEWQDDAIELSEILTALHQIGYKAAPFEADAQERDYHNSMKQYLYRLGIAGLATMQVMMLAVALYLEVFGSLEPEFKHYFRVVSLIFATPVLLYSALPFYINAYRSLKGRTLGMDVPVSLALIFAYVASLWATVTQQGEVFFESISMFTFFLLLGRFLEMRARRKAAAASANLLKLVPTLATTIDGEQVPVKSLQVGDKLRVLPGEHIPADGASLSPVAHVNESMLTGESIPVKKAFGDPVFAGSVNGESVIELEVTASRNDSVLSNIVRLQDEAQYTKPKIAEVADVVARYFVAVILVISALTYTYWTINGSDDAFWIMLSVLVATCPCALSLATPTALTCGASQLGRQGLLMRKSHVIETLCKVNHVVVDKTGTLTHGEFTISKIESVGEFSEQQVIALASELERHANHPISKAFTAFGSQVKFDEVENVVGSGVKGIIGEHEYRIGSMAFVLNGEHQSDPSVIYLSCNGRLIARFHYSDPVREQSADFVAQLQSLGIKVTLLTGDIEQNAQQVAHEVGIAAVVSEAKPQQKLEYLRQLPTDDVTLMVGDGINDAPTLSGAHLSVAMGSGTDIAKTSADMVLLGDKLEKILSGRTIALKTRRIIRENLAWALGYNLIILPLAVMGLVAPYIAVVGMSASSLIVVTNSLRLLK
ncbi:ATPase P [Vibrio sp. qd031]|uniref:heavy metal translocating P-type ATPase n=1 Tax=Vibrio sp. qd031 TaxID=1603038 RepID=UPI000A0F528C|nr:heavy metal translocating P-type ATPase [Vibrio sp. qd031]ORT49760.1 ATPase P [Vibrio sp. qd031]